VIQADYLTCCFVLRSYKITLCGNIYHYNSILRTYIMKQILRKICSPILNVFESGDEEYAIKPLSRKILLVISVLFSGLASVVFYLMPDEADVGYFLPVFIFGGIALVGFIVGLLGTDRAVAKIWGSRS